MGLSSNRISGNRATRIAVIVFATPTTINWNYFKITSDAPSFPMLMPQR
jgi:hypothetical protein